MTIRVELTAFRQFKGTKEVLLSTVKLMKGKLSKALKKFLQKNIVEKDIEEKLAVADKNMAKLLNSSLGINAFRSDKVDELMRCIRFNIHSLIEGISPETFKEMSLGLAHGLGRYKLKLSADKVDTMVIQAVSLFQDLDKEINNYVMRLREWYGYHFPELTKIVQDNIIYTKTVRAIGMRQKVNQVDLSETLPEDVVIEIKSAQEISVGTEIDEKDETFILALADQIVELDNYRTSLAEYLSSRMMAVAPNLSIMVGESIAAKLIAKAGSLINLAKYPASTIQILGAEKALFKAMKTGKQTPKYGTIYQSKLVSSALGRVKGKISRALSAKSALCVRYDALGEAEDAEIGEASKRYIEKRMEYLVQQEKNPGKTFGKQLRPDGGKNFTSGGYNQKADFRLGKRGQQEDGEEEAKPVKKHKL
jgi:nucleolar protein 58